MNLINSLINGFNAVKNIGQLLSIGTAANVNLKSNLGTGKIEPKVTNLSDADMGVNSGYKVQSPNNLIDSYVPISNAKDFDNAQYEFNHNEAEITRNWQEYMSNTSHQREVEDLKKAGLNPILSANAGANAYSAQSASGGSGTDIARLNAAVALEQAKIQANSAANVANIYTQSNQQVAKQQSLTSLVNSLVDLAQYSIVGHKIVGNYTNNANYRMNDSQQKQILTEIGRIVEANNMSSNPYSGMWWLNK